MNFPMLKYLLGLTTKALKIISLEEHYTQIHCFAFNDSVYGDY